MVISSRFLSASFSFLVSQKGTQTGEATLLSNIDEASNVVAASTQVVTASLVGNHDLESHLAEPLPAETITRPLNNILGLGSVYQPLPSFQGKLQETSKQFYVKTGERLPGGRYFGLMTDVHFQPESNLARRGVTSSKVWVMARFIFTKSS